MMKNKMEKFVEIFIMILLTLMVMFAVWQVVTRYVLNNPSSYTEELLIYMMTWLAMVGGAYAYGKNSHIAITYIYNKCTDKNKATISIIVHTLVLTYSSLVLVYGGASLTLVSASRSTASLGVSFAWVYLSTVVAGIMFDVYALSFIKEAYSELKEIEKGEAK